MPHEGLGVVSKAQISRAQSVLPLGRRRDPQPGERQVRFREESTKLVQAPVGCGCHAD